MTPLHPDLEQLVDHLRRHPAPNPATTDIETRRESHAVGTLFTESPPVTMAAILDTRIAGGAGDLMARWYIPVEDAGDGVAIYFHGGGFVVGTLETYDGLARHLAESFAMPVLSVAYRLAPEHPFPAATDDALAATRDLIERRSVWGYEDRHVIVVGDSAGATLAAVTAQALRQESALAGQVLLYPTLGPELVTASRHDFGTGYVLEMEHLHFHFREYLGAMEDHTDVRVTPLLSGDLPGCAPAVIVVAEYDPLRDEAVAYAGLLEHSNVPVDLLEAKGMIHSFFKMGGVVADVTAEFAELGRHVRALMTS
jgi:acetyl esterase